MRRILHVGIVAVSLLLSGCKSAGGTIPDQTPAPTEPYKPTGEIVLAASGMGEGASFDATRVVGSKVNMGRRPDGSWAGRLRNSTVDISVYPNRVSGVGITLAQEITPDGIIITGQHQGRILRFEISGSQMVVRTPSISLTLPRTGEGSYGNGGVVKLRGEAAQASPPWPQFALALVGTF